MNPERLKQLVARIEETLPSVLDTIRTLGEELDERTVDLRAALRAIPDVPEFAPVRARLAHPIAQVTLLRAVLHGDESAARTHDLVRDFYKARRAASRAIRKAG
jgi:hypothetical protein